MSDERNWVDLSGHGFSVRVAEFARPPGSRLVFIRGDGPLDPEQRTALSDMGFVEMNIATQTTWMRPGGTFTLKEIRNVFPMAALKRMPTNATHVRSEGRYPFGEAAIRNDANSKPPIARSPTASPPTSRPLTRSPFQNQSRPRAAVVTSQTAPRSRPLPVPAAFMARPLPGPATAGSPATVEPGADDATVGVEGQPTAPSPSPATRPGNPRPVVPRPVSRRPAVPGGSALAAQIDDDGEELTESVDAAARRRTTDAPSPDAPLEDVARAAISDQEGRSGTPRTFSLPRRTTPSGLASGPVETSMSPSSVSEEMDPELDLDAASDDPGYALDTVNAFQAKYEPASRVGTSIATIPLNMAAETRSALARVAREHGDIDEWVAGKLGWDVETMGRYLSPEQVDAAALAMSSGQRGRGFILADQTGLGKGRILAALARAAALDGRRVVFLTEKANLFTDFWRDVRDTNSEAVLGTPFLVNDGSRIVNPDAPGAPALHAAPRKADINRAIRAAAMPEGSLVAMATYSQFSRKGTLKSAFLRAIAEDAFVICDESHNAVGDSNTSEAIGAALGVASAVAYSSATFARNAENMAAYAPVLPPSLAAGNVAEILRAGGQPLQEALSQMLAEDGVLVRREHDLSNLRIDVRDDVAREERNRAYADALSPILARMARLARAVEDAAEERNDENGSVVEGQPTPAAKKAARERWYTANFGSRLSAILRQFVTALKVDQCVDEAVEALREGMKPVIVVEGTMEALMRELSADDGGGRPGQAAEVPLDLLSDFLRDGDPDADEDMDAGPRPPDFRDALALMLDRVTTLSVKRPGVDPERLPVERPDIVAEADAIRELILGFPDLALSPIDDVRDRIEAEGQRLYEVGEIPAPWVADEISARGMRVQNGIYVPMPSRDRNGVIAAFNGGLSHALVITRAGSTGLSLHASERVADQRKRRMIELQIPSNVVERVQFWGRVNRRGQVCEPDFRTLSTGLPFEMRMLAMQNRKVAELSANVTASADSAAAMEVPDLLDALGNEVCKRLLEDRPSIAERMCIGMRIDPEAADAELYFVNKLLSRLVLLPSDLQAKVFAGVVSAYEDAVREMTAKGSHPRRAREIEGAWRVVAREVHEPGNPDDGEVFGRPVYLTTVQSQRMLKPYTGDEVAVAVDAAREQLRQRLGDRTRQGWFSEAISAIETSRDRILAASLNRRFGSVAEALRSSASNAVKSSAERISGLCRLLRIVEPGLPMSIPDEDGQPAPAVVLDVRMPASAEELHQPGKWVLRYASPGDERPREISLATVMRDTRIVAHAMPVKPSFIHFDKVPRGAVTVTRKLLDGNLVAAVRSARDAGFGIAASYCDERGIRRRGVLVPKARQNRMEAMPGRTKSPQAAFEVVRLGGHIYTDPEKRSAGLIVRADAGMAVIEIPGTKRGAKLFETKEMLAIVGKFQEERWYRAARIQPERLKDAIRVVCEAGLEFHFEGRYRAAALASASKHSDDAARPPEAASNERSMPRRISCP